MYVSKTCPVCISTDVVLEDAYLEPWILFHLYGWKFESNYEGMRTKSALCKNCWFIFNTFRYSGDEILRIYGDYNGERIRNRRPFQPWIDSLSPDVEVFYQNRREIYRTYLLSQGLELKQISALDFFGGGGGGSASQMKFL